MKKIIALLALLFTLTACSTEEYVENADISIAILPGPSSLGFLHLWDKTENNNTINNYNFELRGAPDEIVPLLVQGAVDFAAIPPNLASVVYNATEGEVQVVAINTLGILHLVDTTGEIEQIEDLRGRTVFMSGLGGVPEFAFNYVLNKNGLTPGEDIFIEFRGQHPEIAALLENGEAEIALLPEPFVTTVLNTVNHVNLALDLTEEWNRVQPNYSLIMGVLVGRREFIEENPEAIAIFLDEYETSINFTHTNLSETAELAAYFGIIPNESIAAVAIPRSNITFTTGNTMERYLQGFLRVLYNENPTSIGGSLPSENFFFN